MKETAYRYFGQVVSVMCVFIVGAALAGNPEPEMVTKTKRSVSAFSHELHRDEVGMGCADCHGNVSTSNSSGDNLLPEMAFCGDCHDIESEQGCVTCHKTPKKKSEPTAEFRIGNFAHDKHLEFITSCTICHTNLKVDPDKQTGHRMSMEFCLECHNTRGAPTKCLTCHDSSDNLKPESHTIAWIHSHGKSASIDRTGCSTCHANDTDCAKCHSGFNLEGGRPHPLAYIYSHGLDARLKSAECEKCHSGKRFCTGCHTGLGFPPASHKPGAWWKGSKHGSQAKRDLGSCMTCHPDSGTDSPICANCHF